MHMESFVKDFSGTTHFGILTVCTPSKNDKLYCVLEYQPRPACHFFFIKKNVHCFFLSNETFCHIFLIFYIYESESFNFVYTGGVAKLILCKKTTMRIFSVASFFHLSFLCYDFVKDFSGTTSTEILKFHINVYND